MEALNSTAAKPAATASYVEPAEINLYLVVCALLIVVTIVGNAIVIVTILSTPDLRTKPNHFVLSIAVADFFIGLIIMPGEWYKLLHGNIWTLGSDLCHAWLSLDVFLTTASLGGIGAMAVDRYLAVTRPMIYAYRRTKLLIHGVIVLVWCFAAVTSAMPLLSTQQEVRDQGVDASCELILTPSMAVVSSVLSFYVPAAIVLVTSVGIRGALAARPASLRIDDAGENPEQPAAAAGQMRAHRPDDQRARDEAHANCALLKIAGAVFACWTAFFVLFCVKAFWPSEHLQLPLAIAAWIGWANSSLNPFVYTLLSAKFRTSFLRLFLCYDTRRET